MNIKQLSPIFLQVSRIISPLAPTTMKSVCPSTERLFSPLSRHIFYNIINLLIFFLRYITIKLLHGVSCFLNHSSESCCWRCWRYYEFCALIVSQEYHLKFHRVPVLSVHCYIMHFKI